jgi:hypothetical protein
MNESSFDLGGSHSATASMNSIYKRIQNLRNTLKSSSNNLEISASQPELKQSSALTIGIRAGASEQLSPRSGIQRPSTTKNGFSYKDSASPTQSLYGPQIM